MNNRATKLICALSVFAIMMGVLPLVSADVAVGPIDVPPRSTDVRSEETRDMELTYNMEPEEFVCMDADSMWWKIEVRGEWVYGYWYYGWSYHCFSVGERYREETPGPYETTTSKGWFESKTLMRFDASKQAVPHMKELVKAELVMSPNSTTSIGNVGVYRAIENWTTYSTFSDPNINGEYPGPVDMDMDKVWASATPTQAHLTYTWDITELYRGWMDGTIENQGMFLALEDPHDRGDDPPGAGESNYTMTDLKYKLNGDDGEVIAPTLRITYTGNGAPVANIDSINPQVPVDGNPIIINGSGTDPDGNGISSYRWRLDDKVFAEGPEHSQIELTLPMGQYDLFLSVRDDHPDDPRWSEAVRRSFFVDSSYSLAPPKVTGLSASSNGIEGTMFAEGSQVDFLVTESQNNPDLEGYITILGSSSILINRESMEAKWDGTYTYSWYSQDVPPGTYWVDVTLVDPVTGKQDPDGLKPDSDMVLFLVDGTPPGVGKLQMTRGGTDGLVQPGSTVMVQVFEENGEGDCTGHMNISGPQSATYLELNNLGNGIYAMEWDTTGWPQGEYTLTATLTDLYGNEDTGEEESLFLLLYDTVPPRIVSLLISRTDDLLNVKVQASSQEPGLYALLEISGPESLTEEMDEMGNGWYSLETNTSTFIPGTYDVFVSLEDSSGNLAVDTGHFTVLANNPAPRLIEQYPQDGALVSRTDFALKAVFSEPVSISADQWAFLVSSESGKEVSGAVSQSADGTTYSFTPDDGWVSGQHYVVRVTAAFVDEDGKGLSGFSEWSFTVLMHPPPEPEDDQIGGELELEPESSVTLHANFSDADQVTWYTMSNNTGQWEEAGTGQSFDADVPPSGSTIVMAVAKGPGGEAHLSWSLTPESEDDTDGQNAQGDDSVEGTEDESGGEVSMAGAVLMVLAVMCFVVSIAIIIRSRKESPPGSKPIGTPTTAEKVSAPPKVTKVSKGASASRVAGGAQSSVVKGHQGQPPMRKTGPNPSGYVGASNSPSVVRKGG